MQKNLQGFVNLEGFDKNTIEKKYGKEVWNIMKYLNFRWLMVIN